MENVLSFCEATRSNYWLRTVCPELTAEFAVEHDRNVWRCLAEILRVRDVERGAIASSSLPLTLGGVGVGGALRLQDAAHWGSWADCQEMVRAEHPQVAKNIVRGMQGRVSDCLSAVGVQLPTWEALAGGVLPATSLSPTSRTRCVATSHVQRTERWSDHRVVLCRQCQTGWPDLRWNNPSFVILTSPFAFAPVCSRRPWPPPRSVQQIRGSWQERVRGGECCGSDCGEGSAQVSTNVMLRDLDISLPQNSDN